MSSVAIVEKLSSTTNWDKYFNFKYDKFALCDTKKTKITKKDVTLDLNKLNDYDFVILIGAEATKIVGKTTSVTMYQGSLIDSKFIPLINPGMLRLRPEGETDFVRALSKIHSYVEGEMVTESNLDFRAIDDEKEAIKYIKYLIDNVKLIAVDTETTALYPKDGHILGISISYKINQGVYISTDCISNKVEKLLYILFKKVKCIFHNAKFDLKFLWHHFGFVFPDFECTMMMHYALDENSAHGLKDLALKYTKLGDYDAELRDFIKNDARRRKIKLSDYTYDLIPWEIISTYACYDTAATFALWILFSSKLEAAYKLNKLYNNIIKRAIIFLAKIENNGVPFDTDRLTKAKEEIAEHLLNIEQKFYEFDVIKQFENDSGKKFNPNSVIHLRNIFFLYLRLPSTKITEKGAPSTDKEVMEYLSSLHELPKYILEYKKWNKIKNTYIDKIILGMDGDGRLRTNFNQHIATSGRLSSSGKLNLQQFPRDNPIVKYCIKAREGYKIISQDLATAEMYIAAALSKDKSLCAVFTGKGDFHSSIAKKVFKLNVSVEDVKKEYGDLRQGAKAVSFGVLYGSGPGKVAEVTDLNAEEAKEVISEYFSTFPQLKSWLGIQKNYISNNGYIYSAFGRKRRLINVSSSNKGIASHDVRSGVNFIVQSVASDINLLAAMDMQDYIENSGIDAKIFALVHDSIVAEVKDCDVDKYCKKLKVLTQLDRGCSIPGTPVGVDQEIGEDYAFGKGGKSVLLRS